MGRTGRKTPVGLEMVTKWDGGKAVRKQNSRGSIPAETTVLPTLSIIFFKLHFVFKGFLINERQSTNR